MHHFVVFVYLPKRRFKTTISKKRFKLPHACILENNIEIPDPQLRCYVLRLQALSCSKVLNYLKQRSMVLICSCGGNHFHCITLY